MMLWFLSSIPSSSFIPLPLHPSIHSLLPSSCHPFPLRLPSLPPLLSPSLPSITLYKGSQPLHAQSLPINLNFNQSQHPLFPQPPNPTNHCVCPQLPNLNNHSFPHQPTPMNPTPQTHPPTNLGPMNIQNVSKFPTITKHRTKKEKERKKNRVK